MFLAAEGTKPQSTASASGSAAVNESKGTIDPRQELFRSLLLSRCQQEFQGIVQAKSPSVDPSLRPEQKKELESKATEIKQQKLGLVKFVAELFKRELLTEKILHQNCLVPLLGDSKNPNEENLEQFCLLMSTIGSLLDHQKGKQQMDEYFNRLNELAQNQTLQSRTRSLIQVFESDSF